MFSKNLVRILATVLFLRSSVGAYAANEPLVFNTTSPINDLTGTFAARVQFAQSQILPAHRSKDDNHPHLVGRRKTLLLVRPLKPDVTSPLSVTVRSGSGKTLGLLPLNPPDKLPKTAYYVEGAPPEQPDFTPPQGRRGRQHQPLARSGKVKRSRRQIPD